MSGTAYVDSMLATWKSLEKSIDPEIYAAGEIAIRKTEEGCGNLERYMS